MKGVRPGESEYLRVREDPIRANNNMVKPHGRLVLVD